MAWSEMGWGGIHPVPAGGSDLVGARTPTSPKSRGRGCQAKTTVSFLETLLRKRRRLHLLCTGMFPRVM